MIFSNRFAHFILFKCRTIGTGGIFIGPEWAKKVYKANKHKFGDINHSPQIRDRESNQNLGNRKIIRRI